MMKKSNAFILSLALLHPMATTMAQKSGDKELLMRQEAKEVISSMTMEEKLSQLMNASPGIDRLNIKPYDWWNEGLHGVGRDGRATVFPQPIGLAATFDEELVRQIGDAVATEGRAKFNVAQRLKNYSRNAGLTFWSPNVNIFRDPRWGRGMETYGEDPFLTGTLGTAYVQGLQGDDPFYLKAAACAKHYAVHSGPESTRHEADIHPTKRDFFETYLPAFKMLVQQGKVEVVMAAYNAVYGEACPGSSYMLTEILRNDWGFNGHIVSDCGAVNDIYGGHAMVKTEAEACAVAVKAGLNLECGNTFMAMKSALDQNLLTEADIDNALLPLVMTRLKLGILKEDKDCPYNEMDEDVICCDKHTDLAKRAAVESMVLLKNDNNLLPLNKDIRTLYVGGEGATDIFSQMGNYYGLSPRFSSYLQGIMSKVSNGTSVNFRPGFMLVTPELNEMNWAVGDAAEADYAILVMGNNGNTEGEEGEAIANGTRGDRIGIGLPESQMSFLRRVRESRMGSGKSGGLVVVLTGGSPIDMREICKLADAVVLAWYSGQEGGLALGDLIFGDANFCGRLPITFPADVDKLPALDDYSMRNRTYKYMTDNVMFPFGYGLNYSRVAYADASLADAKSVSGVKKGSPLLVKAVIRNYGKVAVDEVVQVYLASPEAGRKAPNQQLVAFKRVRLAPGSEQTVEFSISAELLETVQEDGSSKLLKGEYHLTIGGAAPCTRSRELGVSLSSFIFKL